MTDRDTFAAAALPFVARRGLTDEQVAAHCYKWADVMLRERGVTNPMPKEKRAEVSGTLTDEEREAIQEAVCQCKLGREREAAATLRNLLERTK